MASNFLSNDITLKNITSPCVKNCCLNLDDVCLGCFRSIEEIIQWHGATDAQKLKILKLADKRRVEITAKENLKRTKWSKR